MKALLSRSIAAIQALPCLTQGRAAFRLAWFTKLHGIEGVRKRLTQLEWQPVNRGHAEEWTHPQYPNSKITISAHQSALETK